MILSRIAALAAILLALTIPAKATPQNIIICNQQGCSDRVLSGATVNKTISVDHRGGNFNRRAVRASEGVSFLPHPAGCPRIAFCACGASVEIFGRSIRALWPARAWYKFPRTSPAAGMVAVRSHHVFVLKQQIEGNIWLAIDHNSGGHMSRLHAVSINGYKIVNPHGSVAGL